MSKIPSMHDDGREQLSFGIISREHHVWSEHSATVLRVGATGLEIETNEPVEPGYVWLQQRISGTRGGFLARSRREGDRYRACIRLVPLTWNVEHCVRERVQRREAFPLRPPAEIIAELGIRNPSRTDQ